MLGFGACWIIDFAGVQQLPVNPSLPFNRQQLSPVGSSSHMAYPVSVRDLNQKPTALSGLTFSLGWLRQFAGDSSTLPSHPGPSPPLDFVSNLGISPNPRHAHFRTPSFSSPNLAGVVGELSFPSPLFCTLHLGPEFEPR